MFFDTREEAQKEADMRNSVIRWRGYDLSHLWEVVHDNGKWWRIEFKPIEEIR